MSFSAVQEIVTHPGSAHKDEFLACCLLLTEHPVPISRREPQPGEEEDSTILLVDVGHRHETEKGNFDHHQFPRAHPPTCSVSLVLKAMGLYEDACAFCDWVEPTEWFDSRGLVETARWLGAEIKTLRRMNSPVDGALLRAFAEQDRHAPGDVIWEVMRIIGKDITGYLRNLRANLEEIRHSSSIWKLEQGEAIFEVLFMPRREEMGSDPSMGMGRFIEREGLKERIVGMVYPDRRGPGYGLARFNDDVRFDFTRIRDCPDVHFAHANGFLAKTTAREEARLQELLRLAWRGYQKNNID